MTVQSLSAGKDSFIIGSPLRGWVLPLDLVPDAVFAERMLGDGIAIDPVGDTLFAPCDCVIANIHAAHHALTLRTSDDLELLVHLGLDTVALKGEGIRVLVEAGSSVERGQPLLQFDLDQIVVCATAAITPMIVAGPQQFGVEVLAAGMIEAGAPLLRIIRKEAAARAAAGGDVVQRTIQVALPHGIHARPAARLTDIARRFAVEASFAFGDRRAPVSSALALLGLGVKHGAMVTIEASGANADAALQAFERLLRDSAHEEQSGPVRIANPQPASSDDGTRLHGVAAAPGLAVGLAFRFQRAETAAGESLEIVDAAGEGARFEAALAEVSSALNQEAQAPGASGAVLAAQLAFLKDASLLEPVRRGIAEGQGAAFAWRAAIKSHVDVLLATGDARIVERAEDLRDVEQRLRARLSGVDHTNLEIPNGSIVIATELLPSQVASLQPGEVRGIALAQGGPTSHAAILAAGKGIPMAVGFGAALVGIENGTMLALDGDRGMLEIAPDEQRLDEIEALTRRECSAQALAGEPCKTADRFRVEVLANLGSVADARIAVEQGAEGCGLLRTEFLFLDRADAPSEDEQRQYYQAIADLLDGRPLVVRLLDVGADKPAPYVSMAAEENPALGVRGVRLALSHPALLETQLHAILSVQPPGRCRVMPAMISNLSEFEGVAQMLERISDELGLTAPIQLGAMVETPAAALIAEQLARRAAFLSIGSNDLAQYALAMDRGNPAVSAELDGLHPAVLRLIAATCEGARKNGVPVAVCGGLAADRLAVPILLGLGVTELSVPPARIAATKAEVASLSIEDCRAFAADLVGLDSATVVRAAASAFLEGRSS